MNKWNELANDKAVARTIESLKTNGINSLVVENAEQAKIKVLEIIPLGSEVMNMTSVTADSISLTSEINESGKFDSVKNKLSKMNRETDGKLMQMTGAAPEWTVGSVHAVTEDGKVMVASNTGSQLGAYSYGANHVIWIVGTQKIVKNLDEGFKRIEEYVLHLESKRARKAYGLPETYNSFISKLLIINREIKPQRITLIFVKEVLGF